MITITRPVVKACPYRDELDFGTLAITFPYDASELHALSRQVDEVAGEPITHEEYTRRVLSLLPEGSSVVTTWGTGLWKVEVREGALLRHDVHQPEDH
jgi:hypothetical protein